MNHTSPTMSADQLSKALSDLKGHKVTEEYIHSRITSEHYDVITGQCIVCTITLDNGFTTRGDSVCVDPANFREDIGKTIAYNKAFDQLWPFFGFLLCEKLNGPGR